LVVRELLVSAIMISARVSAPPTHGHSMMRRLKSWPRWPIIVAAALLVTPENAAPQVARFCDRARVMGPTKQSPTLDGLIVTASELGVAETIDRLEAVVRAKGMTIFARIDHAAAAHEVGLALRPTVLLVFGDPRVGTHLMQAAQTLGIDLPLRALAWEDESGHRWLAFADPRVLTARHGVASETAAVTAKIADALAGPAREATTRH
jgi:uncharacterized protein (DUF302 family)